MTKLGNCEILKNLKSILPVFVILIILVTGFFFLKRKTAAPVEHTFLYFDTFVNVKFYSEKGTNTKSIIDAVDKELERIDSLYGYGKGSLVNDLRFGSRLKITSEESYILSESHFVSNITDGAFDITVGALENVWGFRGNNPHLPLKKDIEQALSETGYENINLQDSTVSLLSDNVIVDLGGISKGYAVDRATEMLKKQGIKAGIVDAGGDLRVFGKNPDGEKWTIGIRNPDRLSAIIKRFSIDEGAVATSGNYERYFLENGKKYHHILNPETGYPANKCVSVTIIAPEAILADAIATGVFVMGPQKGMKLIETMSKVEGVIMYKEDGNLKIANSEGILLRE